MSDSVWRVVMSEDVFDVAIEVAPPPGIPAGSPAWNADLEMLYRNLSETAPGLELRPSREQDRTGQRGVPEFLGCIIVSGISLGAFRAMFEVIKFWLEQRPKVTVKLKLGPGKEMEVSGLSSLSEARELLRRWGVVK